VDKSPFGKRGNGGFKRNNTTLQQEIFENTQGVLERIWGFP
jgi:hypothetical protein